MFTIMNTKNKIKEIAAKRRTFKTSDVLEAMDKRVSRQYISRILKELVDEEELVKGGSTKQSLYALPKNIDALDNTIKKRVKNEDVKEHEVYDELEKQLPALKKLPENVQSILNYAFSEMLNNAIEHSKSDHIEIVIGESGGKINFTVNDFGIGVFRNVMKKNKLKSELEAIQDILKGKTTTDPQAHSGEGIFFTSKVADVFSLESFGYKLKVDNKIEDIFIEKTRRQKKGTKVEFELNKSTKKHLNDVFKKYQSDPSTYAFDKTEIKVRLYTMGTIYISRSQARRILTGLEKFQKIILDFDKVPTVGQAFADEVFRVFNIKHPDIEIQPINMNEAVEFMIKRVESPEK